MDIPALLEQLAAADQRDRRAAKDALVAGEAEAVGPARGALSI